VGYIVISLYHGNCEKFGISKDRLKGLEFMLLLFGSLFINSILSINGYDKWFYALTMWVFWFTVISYKGDKLSMNTLAFPIIIFFSEYYELSFFVYRFMNNYTFGVNYIAITIKMLMIIWVGVELKKNGYDVKRFMLDLFIFSLLYFPISYYIVSFQVGRITLITLKLICLSFVLYELFRNGEVKEWI